MIRKRSLGPIAVLLAVSVAGCPKSTTAPVPGSANSFDSASYLTLVTTDSVIQSTKADLTNDAFPASIAGQVKTALNDLIKGYNVANTTYQSYHLAAMAGTATVAQSNAVTSTLADVQTKTSALTSAKAAQ
jgi:hypothetical protein